MAKYDAITQAAIDYLAIGGSAKRDALEAAVEARHPGAVERAKERREKTLSEARFVGPVPVWAKRYVAKYGSRVDRLRIRQSPTKTYSSGYCYSGRDIVVTLSADKSSEGLVEKKATVLHELAHTMAVYDHHGDRFYDQWYKMLLAEGLYRAVITSGRFVGVSSLRAAARRARASRAA